MMRLVRRAILVLSVACSVAALVVGPISYSRGVPDDKILLSYLQPGTELHAAMIRGILHVVICTQAGSGAATPAECRLGPFYVKRLPLGSTLASGFGLPFWFIAFCAAMPPGLIWWRGSRLRRRRRRDGACVVCGYRLDGLPEPRCPECGVRR